MRITQGYQQILHFGFLQGWEDLDKDKMKDGNSADKRKEATNKDGTSTKTNFSLRRQSPCILVFDSISGTSKVRHCQILR